DRHHTYERQATDDVAVVHGASPVVDGWLGSAAAYLDHRFAASQRDVPRIARQDLRHQATTAQGSPHRAAAGGHADQIPMDLVRGKRIIEDVCISDRVDDGAFEGSARWLGTVAPCLSRRGLSA